VSSAFSFVFLQVTIVEIFPNKEKNDRACDNPEESERAQGRFDLSRLISIGVRLVRDQIVAVSAAATSAALKKEKNKRVRILADVGRDKRRWLREQTTEYFEIFDEIARSGKGSERNVSGRKEISVPELGKALKQSIRTGVDSPFSHLQTDTCFYKWYNPLGWALNGGRRLYNRLTIDEPIDDAYKWKGEHAQYMCVTLGANYVGLTKRS
jgi:hypothetical protein